MQIFYDTSLSTLPSIGQTIELSTELSHHVVVVLRRTLHSEALIANGEGALLYCTITEASKKRCKLIVNNIDENFGRQCNSHITLALAPTKSMDRVEWAVEKAVEIGARVITPIISARSERKTLNVERVQRIAKSAAEQSLKGFMPIVNEPQKFSDFVAQNPNGFIGHCNEGEKITIPHGLQNYIVMIGPEGDFSPEEVELALSHGYKAITLGNSRLRTETAAVCAVYNCSL